MNSTPPQTSVRRLIVLTVLLGTVTVSLNNSAVNPAVPIFMRDFNISPVTAGWVITGFLISMGMTMPLTGYLSDRFGNKTIYLTGLALFICGSFSGVMATTMPWVISARVLQGIAGGLMVPLSLALIFEVYPKGHRGRIMGTWGTAVMLAPALGPALGGMLLQFFDWHVLFAMNIPTGLSAFLIGLYCLPQNRQIRQQKFDWTGFLLVTLGIGILLLALSQLHDRAALSDPRNLGLVSLAMVFLCLFARLELGKPTPLLHLRIFTIPSYSLSVIVVVAQAVGMFSCVMVLPLLMQTIMGYEPVWTGLVLLATALSASIFVKVGGHALDSQGPRYVVSIGLLITALATLAFGWLNQTSPLWMIFLLMIFRGIGIGLSFIPANTAGLSAIPEHLVAQGSAMNNILRRISASIAIVLVSVYYEIRSASLNTSGASQDVSSITAINETFIAIGCLILLALPLAWRLPNSTPQSPKNARNNRVKTMFTSFQLCNGLLSRKQATSIQQPGKVDT